MSRRRVRAYDIEGGVDKLAAPVGAWSNGSQRITSVADPTSAQDAATKAYVDTATTATARESLSAYATGVTVDFFDIRRDGKWREIRGSLNRSLPTGSTDVATAILSGDRPSQNCFANCYLAGGNIGVAFIRPAGTIALNNMSGAARAGSHQFTIIYTVD